METAEQVQMEPVQFPSSQFFHCLIPLSLQCLLLHPVFPPIVSRPIRLALTPISLYLSYRAPFDHHFTPLPQSHGPNFILGIFSMYAIFKGIEWGLAKDLRSYTWVGLDGKKWSGKELDQVREKQASNDDASDIIRSTLFLFSSMRGVGYAWGASIGAPAVPQTSTKTFVRQTLWAIFWSHLLVILCCITIIQTPPSRIAFFSTLFPSLNRSILVQLSKTVASASMGIGVFSGLTLGYNQLALAFCFLTEAIHSIPILPASLLPPPFDSRQYPALLHKPWAPSNVTFFWSRSWHNLFSRPFRALGFDPAVGLFGKAVGRVVGVLAVFAMSALLHEQGLIAGMHYKEPRDPPLTFMERWGGTIYFMAQGVAIILEGVYIKLTRRKVGGLLGFLWTVFWAAFVGNVLSHSWTLIGITEGIPDVSDWSWQRFVIPMACVFPAPVWTK